MKNYLLLCLLLIAFSNLLAQNESRDYSASDEEVLKLRQLYHYPVEKWDSLRCKWFGECYQETPNINQLKTSACPLNKRVWGWYPPNSNTSFYVWQSLSDLSYFAYIVEAGSGNATNAAYIGSWQTDAGIVAAKSNGVNVNLCLKLFSTPPSYQEFSTFFNSASAQNTLIANSISAVIACNAKGINIDFEGPGITSTYQTQFISFLSNLSSQLHAQVPNSELSIDLYGSASNSTPFLNAALPYVDLFIMMGYDYYRGSTHPGPVAPLYQFPQVPGIPANKTVGSVSNDVNNYLQIIPLNKFMLGVPYYGRTWAVTNSCNIPGVQFSNSNYTPSYKQYKQNTSGYYTNTIRDNNTFSAYYCYTALKDSQAFFDDVYSYQKKYEFVNQRNLAGIAIWKLGFDYGVSDLWTLINDNFSTCAVKPCTETIYDMGGPLGNYHNNEHYSFTIAPTGASTVTLTFLQFDLQNNIDFLKIYDGASTLSPLIVSLSGSNLPSAVTSTGGAMTIEFISDATTTKQGYKAVYTCNTGVPSLPTITSTKGTTLCTGDNTILTAVSAGATNYLWSTGATTQSLNVNVAGTYTVTASNVYGNATPSQITIVTTTFSPNGIIWQKCLGGTGNDKASSVEQTSDGGFVISGWTQSNNGDVSGFNGTQDVWIVKIDNAGLLQWQTCLGGSWYDDGTSIIQTSDGGYCVAGFAGSNNGNISGNHGGYDYWIVKLNNTGSLQWQKCLGGMGTEKASAIKQTTDGGYIIVGNTNNSNDGDVSGWHISPFDLDDYWVVKLDDMGIIQWQKCLGGTGDENGYSIQQTTDGGYIIAGSSNSNNGDVSGNHGGFDCWIVKIDNLGIVQWQKCYGGTNNDVAQSIQQTLDGGYVIAGYSQSNDGDVTGSHGGYPYFDYWVFKTDNSGTIQWQKCLGGTNYDNAFALTQTSDGGYVVAGYTQSNNGDVYGTHGGIDSWIVKLDDSGVILWQKSLGGSNEDEAKAIKPTSDGGYIVTGYTSSIDGDVVGNKGGVDYWVVKLGAMGVCSAPNTGLITNSISKNGAKVNWDIISCAEQYSVQYKVTGTSTWVTKNVTSNVGYKSLTGLTAATQYDWRVKTKCSVASNISSGYSAIQHFTTNALKEVETAIDNGIFDCKVFPNPTKGDFVLSFNSDINLKASIEIYNVIGQVAYTNAIEISEGENVVDFDLKNSGTGIYFLNLKTVNGIYRQVILKQ